MIFLQWVLFDLSVISVLFSLDYKLFLLCKMSHPCDDNNASSNTFWLMMTHGDGSCVVVVLVLVLVVVVEQKNSESGTP
jgi:hypothetical protein